VRHSPSINRFINLAPASWDGQLYHGVFTQFGPNGDADLIDKQVHYECLLRLFATINSSMTIID
jgi:hypothetical protein